jgi:hypothetical protein
VRPYQIFAAMPPERAREVLGTLHEKAPAAWAQALGLAAGVMKARPVFLQRQPIERRVQLVRQALARVAANALAEEMLAVYFLECRNELLVEWLDRLGVEHDKGTLKGDPAEPKRQALEKAVREFRAAASDADRADRELLMRAFAAQSSIDWPALDTLLAG